MKSGKLRSRLILSASLLSVGLYGGMTSPQALAANESCVNVSGNTFDCAGNNNGIFYGPLTDLVVYGNGSAVNSAGTVALSGDGDVVFSSKYNNGLITSSAGNDGIYAVRYGSTAYGGDLFVGVGGTVSGQDDGIQTYNIGGSDNIVLTGDNSLVTGVDSGIESFTLLSGGSAVYTGDRSITTGGGDGINSVNSATGYYSGDLYISTGDRSVVAGGDNGIYATNQSAVVNPYGYYIGSFGDLTIVTGDNSTVSGSNYDGILAVNDGSGYFYDGYTGYYYFQGGGDLTITTGDRSSVTGGDDGIDAENYTSGDLTITTGFASTVYGEYSDGIEADNDYSGDLTIATGAYSNVIGGDDDGIDAENYYSGNLTITTGYASSVLGYGGDGIEVDNDESGDLTITTGAYSYVGGYYDGIDAENDDSGDLTITTGYASIVYGGDDDGIYAENDDSGDLTITTGAYSYVGGYSDGIDADNDDSYDLTITTGYASTVYGYDDSGIEADNDDSGDLTITTGAYSYVGGGDDGIDADNDDSGDLTITTGYASTVYGYDGNGIQADNDDSGDLTITTGAFSYVGGYDDGIDARNDDSGDLTITTGYASTVYGFDGDGVYAYNTDSGDLTITTGAFSYVGGYVDGIEASNGFSGDLTITTGYASEVIGYAYGGDGINAFNEYSGDLTITTGDYSDVGGDGDGIDAYNVNSGDLTITTGAYSYVGGGDNGIEADNNESGDLTITTGLESTVDGGNYGIQADNLYSGDLKITTGDDSSVGGDVGGIWANNYDSGNLTINTGYGSEVAGGFFDGIRAINQNSDGLTITTGDGSSVTGADEGIDASNIGSGDLTITTGYDSTVSGYYGDGIFASNEDSGDLTITTGDYSDVLGNVGVAGSDGIHAVNYDSGDVTITTGDFSIVSGDPGINVSNSFSGDLNITTGADSLTYGALDGIYAYNYQSGDATITTGDDSDTVGDAGSGVSVQSIASGDVFVFNNGNIYGSYAAVDVYTDGADAEIHNDGFMSNLGGLDSDLVIHADSLGSVFIDNTGEVIGRVETGAGDDLMVNYGDWQTLGTSDFGNGTDKLSNGGTGVIRVANEAGVANNTTFQNLESTYNAGLITMVDQVKGDGSNISDRLTVSGDFIGLGGTLAVDAFLGAPGSVADVLVIGGSSSGNTAIAVNDTNPGPGAYNPTGILVVDVNGASNASHFSLAGGPIDKGLFFYDLVYDGSGPTNQHLLMGLPDREVFETLAATAAATNVWYDSADAWSNRQDTLRDQLMHNCTTIQAVADPPMAANTCAGSLWVSMRGSWTERDWDVGYSVLNKSYDFDLSYGQDTYGIVGGADFGVALDGGGQFLFGALAGYMNSSVEFDESPTTIDLEGGTFGLYATWLQHGFFVDVLGKVDLMNADYSAPSLKPYGDSDSGSVTALGARADVGYHMQMGSAFIEPVASFTAVSTNMDDLSLGGGSASDGQTESLRGGLGARLGFDGDMFSGALTGKAWYAFTEEDTMTIESAGPDLDISEDGREGLYGEVSGQFDVKLSPNASLFLNGGVEFGEEFTSTSVTGGFSWTW